MLTDKEKRWLEGRDLRPAPCDNELPGALCDCCIEIIGTVCPLKPDYRDAAEFEARVSRCIAENASELDMISNNLQFLEGFKAKSLAWYILREARIAVEEEMDNERNHA